MDQAIRNKLRGVVTQCRKLLEDSVRQELQGKFGIAAAKKDDVQVDDEARMSHLSAEERVARKDILDHFAHIKARGFKAREALDQLVREIAFTHLNRLCAYKMMEARQVYVGDHRFREAVSRGVNSNGVKFYLADHADDERLFNTGKQDVAYRHFLDWLGGLLSEEIGVLFNPHDSANRLYPTQHVLDQVLDLINDESLADIWAQDETIGWVYQYFTPKELRDQARKESAAPRNSYELAFRNQFFTPRYVVEFLTDNTLGRIWYEMRRGQTRLKDQCRYMVRRPNEVFLSDPLAGRRDGDPAKSADDLPATVQAAFRGDFANAIAEKDAQRRYWIGRVVPPDQYEAATGHPFRENDDHPSVKEVWSTIHEHPERITSLHPLKILVALSQLVRTASGGPYAARAADELWAALSTAVQAQAEQGELSHEGLLKQPVCIPFRPKKDPRELRILDPACGSGHFLLYCFDLLLTIYEEAYADPDLGPNLKKEYPTLDALRRDAPRLILAHNLHGIDIDLRCAQIAALALWLRCQRAYRELGLKQERPKITRSNIVCAEPMPGEKEILDEFLKTLKQDRLETLIRRVMQVPEGSRVRATESMIESLTDLVRLVWEKMQLAGEAGSLLKIEGELLEAIQKGREEWEERQPLFRFTEFSLTEKPKETYVRYVPGEGVTFWQRAEALVLEALRDYVRHARDGRLLQRQLFADDAEQGFAFIDLCQRKYDVVLMNPPFGTATPLAATYLAPAYPRSKNDLYSACVERGLAILSAAGMLGAITSRTGFFLSSFTKWREDLLLQEAHLSVLADFGFGVLDTAKVETAAYCLSAAHLRQTSVFFRLLGESNVSNSLFESVRLLEHHRAMPVTFLADPDSFRQVPGSPFAYWVSEKTRHLFKALPSFENDRRTVKQGLATADDFRFVRAWWKVPADAILIGSDGTSRKDFIKATTLGKQWVPIVKGGVNTPFHGDIMLIANWKDDGHELKEFRGSVIRNPDYYFQPGLTWPARPWLRGFFSFVPPGTLFTHTGMMIFLPEQDRVPVCGILNSDAYAGLLHLLMARGIGVETDQTLKYEVGYISSVPVPACEAPTRKRLEQLSIKCHEEVRSLDFVRETSHFFLAPPIRNAKEKSLSDVSQAWSQQVSDAWSAINKCRQQINEISFELYGINSADRRCLEEGLDKRTAADSTREEENSGCVEDDLKATEIAPDTISYCVGCAFGRWDARVVTGEKEPIRCSSAFSPLPARSAGMFQGEDCTDLPIRISSDGVIPDDPDHSDDIVRRVREVLELIWKDRADAIEKEACEILGVKDLREYFRKPGKGGFWDDHVSRYSKSRRKAPIYWLLQSSKRNYALWVYYHRLDKETLLKALLPTGPVQTKINREQSRLDELRKKRMAAEGDNKTRKQLDKDIDKQEELLNEIKDFAEKLERAAKLDFGDKDKLNSNIQYTPDLNDGVVLNIAPLHELVPWREAGNCWKKLLEGEYEWSSMSELLREKGLVK